jgi:bacillithiol biosynthesis cysteine-adding enzyme BshC
LQISDYSFDDLPFSELFKTYINDYQQLSDFYAAAPFDDEAITQKVKQFNFTGDRPKSVKALKAFNQQFDVDQAALTNLDRLKNKEALAIVTGQQMGIYGGPMYTMLKTVSVIHLARKLEKKLERPVIPVFWLADEDHDYDEVRELNILNKGELEQFSLPPKENPVPTVAELTIPEQIGQMRRQLKESMYDTDFSDDLWELLDSCFQPGKTFFQSFGSFISSLFSKHGLVLAGSNHPEIKNITGSVLEESVTEANAIRQELESQTKRLDEAFHQQVTLYDSNLFYLDEEGVRIKISSNSQGWHTDAGQSWDTEQLVAEICQHPERFSPNVFMRPVLQDLLLPTLGYVAGPGETAYYGQMKGMYECFGMEMPIIFPRLSATFVEPAIDRICNELPFEFNEYEQRIEDLESGYVDRTEQYDLEKIFGDWKEGVKQFAAPHKDRISDIDPTLEAAVEKSTARYFGELDKLKGKVYRAVKKRDDIQLKRIRRIKANIFPGDELQERMLASIFYMNKYGVDLWDRLLESLNETEQFNSHKIVKL